MRHTGEGVMRCSFVLSPLSQNFMDRIRELKHRRKLTKGFGYTTRGNLRQRVPKGFWHTIQTDSLTSEQVDALVELRLKHTFNSKLAMEFIQLLPEEFKSKFKCRVVGCHSFWQEAARFIIQNEELAEFQDGKLILKLELLDGTKVRLDMARKRE